MKGVPPLRRRGSDADRDPKHKAADTFMFSELLWKTMTHDGEGKPCVQREEWRENVASGRGKEWKFS